MSSLIKERGDVGFLRPAFFNRCGLLRCSGELIVSGSSGPEVAVVDLDKSFEFRVSVEASIYSKAEEVGLVLIIISVVVSAVPA